MRQEKAEKKDMEVPYKLPHGCRWVRMGEASGKGRSSSDSSERVIRRSRCHSSKEE